MASFFAELKRRNVYKVAVAYAVVAWLLIQAASILFPTYEAPAWVMKVFLAVVVAGFPIALVIAWAFELTPEGLKRTENASPDESRPSSLRKFATLLAVIALLAAGLLAFQLLRPRSASNSPIAQGPESKSIAVLPFTSLSEDKTNAYFADGIQDEILTRLSKISALKVISRTSTQQYQSKPTNLGEIAKQLGVTHILEGSVQKSGESVRVNVQLIKADADSHLWAETYDRKLTDIFAVETEVAQRIADSLEAKLTGSEKAAINHIGTKIPAAYDAFLRGIALRPSQSTEDNERLIQFMRQAVALDPNYAEAWASLTFAEGLKFVQGGRVEALRGVVQTAAENALRLDPARGNGHAAMGVYLYYCLQDYDGAWRELQQAREQAPNDPIIIQALGLVKRRQGKLDEAIDLQLRSAQLDPLNQDIWINIAWTYRGMRRFADAIAIYDRAQGIAPNDKSIVWRRAEADLAAGGDLTKAARALRFYEQAPPAFGSREYNALNEILIFQRKFDEVIAKITAGLEQAGPDKISLAELARVHLGLGEMHLIAGRPAEARPWLLQAEKELMTLRTQGNNGPEVRAHLIEVYACLGRKEDVDREASDHIARQAKDRWTGPLAEEDVARAYIILGENDRALSILERLLSQAYADSVTPALLRLDPLFDRIRNDPRFRKLSEAQ
jgi:TolB-like protein/Tfp pilus assembly protein PilF